VNLFSTGEVFLLAGPVDLFLGEEINLLSRLEIKKGMGEVLKEQGAEGFKRFG